MVSSPETDLRHPAVASRDRPRGRDHDLPFANCRSETFGQFDRRRLDNYESAFPRCRVRVNVRLKLKENQQLTFLFFECSIFTDNFLCRLYTKSLFSKVLYN